MITTQNNCSAVECVTYDKDHTDEASNNEEYDKKRMMKSIELKKNLFLGLMHIHKMHLNYYKSVEVASVITIHKI